MKKELFVSLKTEDSTEISVFGVLNRMGYKVCNVDRYDYYSFELEKNSIPELMKCDILVNANKHKAETELNRNKKVIYILVEDDEKPKSLLNTLKKRLGFKEIENMTKGVICGIEFIETDTESSSLSSEQAKKIAEELLCNKHYQSFRIF